MNKNIHLNLFKHYSEIGLENNLTRALVITLQNDPLFLNEFFYKITNKNEFSERGWIYGSYQSGCGCSGWYVGGSVEGVFLL